MPNFQRYVRPLLVAVAMLCATPAQAADKPIKAFICAGQSNMVGWGDSTKLPNDLRKGNDRVLMFEDGKWQPLRPHEPAFGGQKRVGLTEYHFGPEIAFGHEMAKTWPEETIGIIKFSIGGTSVLAWKPDWSKEDADRVGQGRHGSLYKKLMQKVDAASKVRDIEIVGFLWLQGGGDMKKADVAKEYLDNLKSLVTAVRKATGVADLPFIYGSPRQEGIPDDLADFKPPRLPPGRPGAWLVLKAQFDAQKAIPHSKMVILRDIEKHPRNVHYNTAGQLVVGKLFAEEFLNHSQHSVRLAPPNCPACAMGLTAECVFNRLDVDEDKIVTVQEFRKSPGMQNEAAAAAAVEAVGRIDKDGDGFIEADELGELHQSRMNDPKSMRERLQSGDVRKPPQDKRPKGDANEIDHE